MAGEAPHPALRMPSPVIHPRPSAAESHSLHRMRRLRFQAAEREAALAAEVTRLKADLAVAARALENSCQHAPTRVLAACHDLARWARANADIRALPHNSRALANALVQAGVTTTIQAATQLLHKITIGCNGEPTAEGTNNSFYALHADAGLRVSKAHVSHAKALTIAARQRDICAVLALAPASVAIPIGLHDTAVVMSLSPNYGQSLGRSGSLFQAATDVSLQDAIFSAVLGTIARLSALCVLFHDCKPDNLVFLSDTREVVIVDFDDFLFPGTTPLLQPRSFQCVNFAIAVATFYINLPVGWVIHRIRQRLESNFPIALAAYSAQSSPSTKRANFTGYGPLAAPEIHQTALALADLMQAAVAIHDLRTAIASLLSTFAHYVHVFCKNHPMAVEVPLRDSLKPLAAKAIEHQLGDLKRFLASAQLYADSQEGRNLREKVSFRFFAFLFHVLYAFSGQNLHDNEKPRLPDQTVAPHWSDDAYRFQCIHSRRKLFDSLKLLVGLAADPADPTVRNGGFTPIPPLKRKPPLFGDLTS